MEFISTRFIFLPLMSINVYLISRKACHLHDGGTGSDVTQEWTQQECLQWDLFSSYSRVKSESSARNIGSNLSQALVKQNTKMLGAVNPVFSGFQTSVVEW